MKKLDLNLEKLKTLSTSQTAEVAGGVRMSWDGGCGETLDCGAPASIGNTCQSSIGTKGTLAPTIRS